VFTFLPNTLANVWRQDVLPLNNLPAPNYVDVPIRVLKPYLIFGGPLNQTGINNFLHRFHMSTLAPCSEIINGNNDNSMWTMTILNDPSRLYYRIRYGGSIRQSGVIVCHYLMGFPQYRQ
jgi:hypothetical protein